MRFKTFLLSTVLTITAFAAPSDSQTPDPQACAATPCPALGPHEVIRAIVGLEKTGASGTAGSENFVFDFFITRPALGPRVRWWGDVKVEAAPQQVNSQWVNIEQQFAAAYGDLKVNQLAQSVEFITGPEFVLTPDRSSRFQFTLFAGAGASGPNNPTDAAAVFDLPASGTPASAAFINQFGTPPEGAKYVAFLPDSNDRFLRQWQAGLRLYTIYPRSQNAAGPLPASVEFSAGQNEMITGGRLFGWVGHVAAMHPITFTANGKPVTVYLFGEATTAFARSSPVVPITLAPALSNASPVPLTDPGVYTISVPANRRDTYRIGIGIDLLSVLETLFSSGKPSAPAN